jgi:hypothetical protein
MDPIRRQVKSAWFSTIMFPFRESSTNKIDESLMRLKPMRILPITVKFELLKYFYTYVTRVADPDQKRSALSLVPKNY